MKRLILADDHPMVLEGLIGILRNDFEIVGTATNGRALVELAERLKPDIILLDVSMPEMNGIEAARRIHKTLPSAKIVFVTQQNDQAYVRAAFEAGAIGYVSKQSAGEELRHAAQLVLQGRYYVSPFAIERDPNLEVMHESRSKPSDLFGGLITQRQREVLQLIAEGKSTKEIAELLKISAKTVEFHRAGLMNELGLRTIAELTRYAVAHRIVSD
jgi:DNA-binding NarL/FixJ family response regulator